MLTQRPQTRTVTNRAMKLHIFFFFSVLSISIFAQDWSDEELFRANTAAHCPYLTELEKEALLYVNLARMYPQKYALVELSEITDPEVLNAMNSAKSCEPLSISHDAINALRLTAKEYMTTSHVNKDNLKQLSWAYFFGPADAKLVINQRFAKSSFFRECVFDPRYKSAAVTATFSDSNYNSHCYFTAFSRALGYTYSTSETPVKQSIAISSQWAQEEIYNANTAAQCPYLTEQEKQVILYINLARMYPKKFAQVEVDYTDNDYVTSLINTLYSATPVEPVTVSNKMIIAARCWAKEMGENGLKGHNRISCKKIHDAECCDYGYDSGRDIVMRLLIDDGVQSLGHRKILLRADYHAAGVAINTHIDHKYCAVIDFSVEQGDTYR